MGLLLLYLYLYLYLYHKNARFLKLWLESYRIYLPEDWYMNAGVKPMREILTYKPELVHNAKTVWVLINWVRECAVGTKKKTLRKYYSVHFLIRFI
jgi:hypothetical protein